LDWKKKKQIKKARGSLCLSDEDLVKRLREEIKDISDIFEILTEDLMALSLRVNDDRVKRDYILKKAVEIDNLNVNFSNVKKIFEKVN
jgi:predicted RNase H-like nuclease (RuvC/YqgF family)